MNELVFHPIPWGEVFLWVLAILFLYQGRQASDGIKNMNARTQNLEAKLDRIIALLEGQDRKK